MTKQEYIQQAWGVYWDEVKDFLDEDGRLSYAHCSRIWNLYDDGCTSFKRIAKELELTNDADYMDYQPNALCGVEYNNGWTTIEDESDVPHEIGSLYWVMKKGYDYPITTPFYKNDQDYWLEHYTHYQLISKPKPPLYT